MFDVAVAVCGLVLLAPLFAAVALWIRLDSPGPARCFQERVGRGGTIFRIHKFRTMHDGAMAAGPAITVGADPRISRAGAFLRRYKLDELPQLIDVLRGDMSLVGPRPELARYVAFYPPALRDKVLSVRPGITDPTSLEYRDESERLARERSRARIPRSRAARQAASVGALRRHGDARKRPARDRADAQSPVHRLMRNTDADSIWHRLERALTRVRPYRRPLSLLIDGVTICVCWNLTYLFRLGFERWRSARPDYDPAVMLGVAAIYLVAFVVAGVPQSMWRFSGFGEVKRLTMACAAAGLASAAVVLVLELRAVPRAVLALHPFVSLMGVCMVRIAYRMLYEHARARITGSDEQVRRAIVLGAGGAAKRLLAAIHHEVWQVLGLLDDDPAKRDARIAGVAVLGTIADLGRDDVRAGATHVIVAMPGAPLVARRRAIDRAAATGLPVLTVPSISELQSGTAAIERVRSIEPEDLLGRDPVELDEAGIGVLVAGKTVLVTGAGGSIGSELCRQLARYRPASIVLYELSEFASTRSSRAWASCIPRSTLVRLIGDVKDLAHLRETFATIDPSSFSRSSVQARAADGRRERVGGVAEQHPRHAARRHGGGRGRRRALRPDLDRQGRQSDQRDGGKQEGRGDGAVAIGDPWSRDHLLGGALRQRPRLERQRDPEVQGADRQGRPGHRHPPGDDALFHDRDRGGAVGVAGSDAGEDGRGLCPRHGRAGDDSRARAGPDPALRTSRRRDPDCLQRPALRRKAVRGAARRCRPDACVAPSPPSHCPPAGHRRPRCSPWTAGRNARRWTVRRASVAAGGGR